MVRSIAPAIVLFAVLIPPLAHAQVNIDQDKTPAHIYASDCSVCHKSMRGLANGRGSSALTGFLAEHYTSSEQEAAALAAYVLAGGGGTGSPAPARDALEPDRDRTASAESKTRDTRRSPRPLPEPTAAAKPRPKDRGRTERPERSASAEPGRSERRLPAGRARERLKPAEATPVRPEPPKLAAVPKVVKPLKPDSGPPMQSPTMTTPADNQPSGAAPAPTDNIPD